MNLQDLRYVLEIINYGSVSCAARKLYISQPYLSKVLMRVEKEYGITIFSRTKNNLVLTESGAAFSLAVRELLDTMENFDRNLHQLRNVRHLSFSSCPTAFTLEAYLEFIRSSENTNLRINYKESDNNTVINDVYSRSSEFGIIILNNETFRSTESLLKSMHLICERLSELQFFLITRIGHPLSRLMRPIQLEDLYNYDLVLYPQYRSTENDVAETAQYEYNSHQIDWSRIRHITYVQSRAQYYDLIQKTDTVSFGFQPIKNQETNRGIASLQVDSAFTMALGRDANSTLCVIYAEGHALSPLAADIVNRIRELDQ